MSEWKEYKLGEIAELRSEKFTPNKDTLYPYIGLEHIEPKSLKLNGIGTSNDVSSQKSIFYPNDTLYGKLRPYFQKVISPNFKGVCSTDIFVVKPKKEVNHKFLFYLLATDEFTNLANLGSTGTRMPRADWKHLKTTCWHIPDLPTQTAIAEILSSLDDKIELNNKINQELENLAQILFKQWFIDFEFPNENGKPYKSSGGEMVDSELGEIPKGWEVLKIGEVLDFISGYPFKGASFSKDGNYGIVTIKNVQDGLFLEQIDNYIDELPNKFPVNTMLTVGDILMSLTGNVGRVCYVTSDNCLLNQRVVKFKSVQKNANAFWYYYFRQYAIKEVLISISKGTAQLNLSPVETKLLQCKLPRIIAPHILSAFDAIFSKQIECSMENKNLSNLRDTLLPKLISGELEVSQAQTTA